ncbi:MAG TPA: twin-arginine translocation signal domain-containing protein, partial [Oceanipulchritudo sp.]|nr:twin-arginine translocation signal domain-containing protein [Oceanipulchritudo sp.]
MHRRKFLSQAGLGVAAVGLGSAWGSVSAAPNSTAMPIYVFSKHLQFLGYEALAKTAGELGFDGIDLTVRRRGHVLPERVREDLPNAV